MTDRKINIRFDEKQNYYIARFTVSMEDGKSVRKSFTGRTEAEVQEKLQQYEDEAKALQPGSSDATLRIYFKKWFSIKKQEVKPNSYRRYESLYATYISKAPFINAKLTDVLYSDLKAWYASLQTAGASIKTVEFIHTLIKGVYISAIEDRLVSFNPCNKIRFKSTQSRKAQALKREEHIKLIQYLQENEDEMGELILFDLGTGLRLGECLALRWTDLDMIRGVAHVSRSLQRVTRGNKYIDEESTPKSPNSIRDVPMPGPVFEMLKKRQKDDDSLVFSDEKGGYVFNKKPLRHLQALCKLLGINVITFHDLRHTYATRLFESGVPIKAVQVLLGHSDISITAEIYTHVMKPEKSNAAAKLDELYE